MLNVKLLEYAHVEKDNSCVIGEVDFYVVEKKYTARRVRHLKKGNNKWFNWPSFARDKEDGSTQWYALGEFPSEENEEIFAKLKIEVDKHLIEIDKGSSAHATEESMSNTRLTGEEIPF